MAATFRLALPVLLPDVPDERDACVASLTDELTATTGIESAHVLPAHDGEPAQVCIHYDPDQLALPRIRRIAERTGARITGRYGHVVWEAEGLRHQRRTRTITERLKREPGGADAEANATGPIRIEFDRETTDEAALRRGLREVGVTGAAAQPPERGPGGG